MSTPLMQALGSAAYCLASMSAPALGDSTHFVGTIPMQGGR